MKHIRIRRLLLIYKINIIISTLLKRASQYNKFLIIKIIVTDENTLLRQWHIIAI